MKLQSPDGSKRPLYIFTVLGRLFMSLQADNPFECVDRVLKEIPESDPLVLVEIHAEATSEKQAISRHLDGRVSAVLGTHTHVPTDLPAPSGGRIQVEAPLPKHMAESWKFLGFNENDANGAAG